MHRRGFFAGLAQLAAAGVSSLPFVDRQQADSYRCWWRESCDGQAQPIDWDEIQPGDRLMQVDVVDGQTAAIEFFEALESPVGNRLEVDGFASFRFDGRQSLPDGRVVDRVKAALHARRENRT